MRVRWGRTIYWIAVCEHYFKEEMILCHYFALSSIEKSFSLYLATPNMQINTDSSIPCIVRLNMFLHTNSKPKI